MKNYKTCLLYTSRIELEKYTVTNIKVGNLLSDAEVGNIAIPEIQRPFVWKKSKVRDLID